MPKEKTLSQKNDKAIKVSEAINWIAVIAISGVAFIFLTPVGGLVVTFIALVIGGHNVSSFKRDRLNDELRENLRKNK